MMEFFYIQHAISCTELCQPILSKTSEKPQSKNHCCDAQNFQHMLNRMLNRVMQ